MRSARKRKKEDEDEDEDAEEAAAEKRAARFVSIPSKQVQERMDRAVEHRLYLIDKDIETDCSRGSFVILGATGNVYNVTLDKNPSCDCPDFGRCYTCKHILFVLLRVVKLPRTDHRLWQKALLSSEVKELLQMCASNGEEAVLASQRVRQRFKQIHGKDKDEDGQTEAKSIQRSIEGDCPICYEAMASADGTPAEELVFCKSCGNNVHKDCFDRWSRSKSSSYSKVTCIYCRAVWEHKCGATADASSSGYVNLASYSEDHNEANTSLEALYPDCYEWIARR
ncbi:mitogen-activated protein kinase kinase kinase 1 [Selaginella moellendorffii]|uniref:mitogen-activated protein kinase kinase kinase 1 n=1 Tax=Selaginella moellendorffii TaxID=88036 RepID=UPI000D1CE8AE|nr:mitogen-activated protein kinase kinase kinase 1 [Selaginella moellendorffii]|eukprot:XP_024521244.1 mitogen-activated protein kinase kinase kinase 1 [Selaginella moellendorffii]